MTEPADPSLDPSTDPSTGGGGDLASALEQLVSEVALSDAEPFDADTDLLLGGLVDSMGVVQIVQWLEERYDAEIEPADVVLENFRSIRSIIEFVDRRLGSPSL